MLESQLSVIVCTTSTTYVDSLCAKIQLTSIISGIVGSNLEVQRTMFPAQPRMAGSPATEPSMAISELTVTNPELTISTPDHSSRRAKLDLPLLENTQGLGT